MTFRQIIETAYRELGVPEHVLQKAIVAANDSLRSHPHFKYMEDQVPDAAERPLINKLKQILGDPAIREAYRKDGNERTAKWVAGN